MCRCGMASKNLFEDDAGELGVSQLGYNFIGGVIQHADALAALLNPTVNSYKRINAPAHRLRRHLGAQHRDLFRQ